MKNRLSRGGRRDPLIHSSIIKCTALHLVLALVLLLLVFLPDETFDYIATSHVEECRAGGPNVENDEKRNEVWGRVVRKRTVVHPPSRIISSADN